MSKTIFKIALASSPLLLAACAQQQPEPSVWDEADERSASEAPENQFGFAKAMEEPRLVPSFDVPSAERAPPGISVTAAPGVAFTYRYAFVLASDQIAAQQELHATACEELGISKCRITGMRYKLIDEDKVEAFLQFKLSPELAREFGKDGIASVEDAGGRLIEAVIVGDDAATRIEQSQNNSERINETIEDLQQQLRRGGLSAEDRTRIQQQIDSLRGQIRGEEQAREVLSASLANTPMTYYYRSGEGFTLSTTPIGDAGNTAWMSFSAMIAAVLLVLGVALPWVLLGLALLALWRTAPAKRVRSWVRPPRPKAPETFGEIGDGGGPSA